jgi:hypothetical protein
MPNAIV